MKIIETINDFYSDRLGVTPYYVNIVDYNKVPCLNQDKVKQVLEIVTPHNCHYNSAMAALLLGNDPSFEIGFCEGSTYVNHCWNYIIDKKSGIKYYVDFTLNEECNGAMVVSEWTRSEILELFDECENAFIPFVSFYEYGSKEAKKLIRNKYPKLADVDW